MKRLIQALSYEPVALDFGTSGLRGLVLDMTDLECYINTAGFVDYLHGQGLSPGSTIYIAGDLRDSTPRIMRAVVKAVQDKGLHAVYCGLVPTPTLAFYALEDQAPCIMVTGSHIPADRNGIKFYKSDGEVLKQDEAAIKRRVAKSRDDLYATDLKNSGFLPSGMMKNTEALPAINQEAQDIFIERYGNFAGKPLKDKHVVVYQHSAVGRDMLCMVLENLGARVTAVGRSDSFVSIDTENVTPENEAYFRSLAEKYPDNFAIVSTDGDSDRPFVIDEKGLFYRGDVLGCLVARELGAKFVAVPISSNDAVDEFCAANNISVVHTKIGSPYVVNAMQASNHRNVAGWEVNGGFLLGSEAEFMGVKLKPLPTRDAFLPILVTLMAVARKGLAVSEFFSQLPRRYTGGGLIGDVPVDKIARFREICDNNQISDVIETALGSTDLGRAKKIDLTDGLRMIFGSGDVIHLRPSGNAPQFRVYSNASSQDKANELVNKAIAPGGYIESLLDAL